MQINNITPLKSNIMQHPFTQYQLQANMLNCILDQLPLSDPEDISSIKSEITQKCPIINMGDSLYIWVNPDDLTIEFLNYQEIESEEKSNPGFFSEYFTTHLLEETENNDISLSIAIY